MDGEPLRRLVYASRSTGDDVEHDHRSILITSIRNNGMDGLTGVLWACGDRYLQLLEGPPESVEDAFARILADERHEEVQVLDDRSTDERLFGEWAMAGLPGARPKDAEDRLRMLLRNAPDDVRSYFSTAARTD